MKIETDSFNGNNLQKPSLIVGLFHNTFYNTIGWIWPVILGIFSVPFILHRLGDEVYGVFGLVSILAGYLSLLNSPMVVANIRFLADAYGRQDWDEYNRYVFSGLWVSAGITGIGALLLFLLADMVTTYVFNIPKSIIPQATLAFKIAAGSFFLNGIVGALRGIPSSMRRFDAQNIIGMIVGTVNTAGIVLAVTFGWGIIGAVWAQFLSSLLAVSLFGYVALRLMIVSNISTTPGFVDRKSIMKLLSNSTNLFGGLMFSTIGIQIDRTIIGVVLGPTAVTYYSLPTKLTDNISGLLERLTITLYPLSAEGLATGQINELKLIYFDMMRWMFLISAYIATIFIVSSKDILVVWVGSGVADKSWLVFSILAFSHIARSAGSVCNQVLLGFGRSGYYALIGLSVLIVNITLIMMFMPVFGLVGVALAIAIGLFITNCLGDIITQRVLLKQMDWYVTFLPYLRTYLIVGILVGISLLVPISRIGWQGIIVKSIIYSLGFLILAIIFGGVRFRDLQELYLNLRGA